MHNSPSAARVSLLRKLIHLAMGLIPLAGWLVGYWLALALAGASLAASVAVEAGRRWWPWVNRLLWHWLPSVFREGEDCRVLGSTWFTIGSVATLLLCGRDAGGTAVLYLSWGDAAAELVGGRWGRSTGGKSLVGSLACLATCLLAGIVGVLLGGLSPWAVLAGVVVATLVERRSPPPDDNVWMPVLSGLAILLVQWLTGGETAHIEAIRRCLNPL
jgi:dolichol kinase